MRTIVLSALLLAAVLAGCTGTHSAPAPATPARHDTGPTPAPAQLATRMDYLASAKFNASDSPQGLGEWIDDGLLYLSGGAGLRIVDIHDPANPVVLSEDTPDTNSRDVDLIHHPNGRLYAVLADDGESQMKLVDVTDPHAPALVAKTTTCVHTVAVVPGTTVVYGSWSLCQATRPAQMLDGDVEIVDFKDPQHPVSKLFVFPPAAMVGGRPHPITATSCHEMTFNAQLHRAYCAAITDTQVWDDSDPLDPTIIGVIDDPLVNIHHSVWDADNGTTLVLGDEVAGAEAPAPTCSDKADLPTSALAFYDIKDLANPVRLGSYNIPYDSLGGGEGTATKVCTTHLGDVIDGTDRIVMGWYVAGTVLVDFSDPAHAKTVATWRADGATSVWETRYYQGHVYSADEVRGLDVLTLAAGDASR
jgi:hypothetical protein